MKPERWLLRSTIAYYQLFRAYENGRIEAALKTVGLITPYAWSWSKRRQMRREAQMGKAA